MRTLKYLSLALISMVLLTPNLHAQSSYSGGPFEGNWEHCEYYQGSKVCGGHVLLQNGSNVCGTWAYFATNADYEGQIQLTTVRHLTAKKDLICGTPGSETSVKCKSSDSPNGGWEPARGYMMVCNGALNEADAPSIEKCATYYRKKKIPAAQLQSLLATPWVKECLARPAPRQ